MNIHLSQESSRCQAASWRAGVAGRNKMQMTVLKNGGNLQDSHFITARGAGG
jgi:hypothetical protein